MGRQRRARVKWVFSPSVAQIQCSQRRHVFLGVFGGFHTKSRIFAPNPTSPHNLSQGIINTVTAQRRELPESPRWLDRQGRTAEASAVLDKMEAEFKSARGALPPVLSEPEATQTLAVHKGTFYSNFVALWSPKLMRVTAMSWILFLTITFTYYAFFTWIPTLLVHNGLTITKSFSYSVAIYLAQIPGYYSAAWINDRFGRQLSIASYLVLGGVSAIAMTVSHLNSVIIIGAIFLSFFMNGTYAGVYTYISEVFPTELRGTGFGVASSIGRIGGAASPIIVGLIFPSYGFAGVFGLSALTLIIGALAVIFLGIPTLNKSLEEIAQRP